MYDTIKTEIDRQLAAFQSARRRDYKALEAAWIAARRWADGGRRPTGKEQLLLPYVGSGLNQLAAGNVGSWDHLVRLVGEAAGTVQNEYHVARSGLSLPQQLELLLGQAQANNRTLRVSSAFRKAFSHSTPPRGESLHRRLVTMFPILLTTNYNTLLSEAAGRTHQVYDLTEPWCPLRGIPNRRAIVHLHGVWDSRRSRGGAQPGVRIFAGIGLEELKGPCLVLTEHRYYKLYRRDRFRKALQGLFGNGTLLLFIGASLSRDEAGIHAALMERVLADQDFAGLYVGLDLDPLKKELLELRGIRALTLTRDFGFGRQAIEPLFHALLDVLEERFCGRATRSRTYHSLQPDILCVGIPALNRVVSLGDRKEIGKEIAFKIDRAHTVEEAGGQHFAPALHLVEHGYRVAIAMAIGDDKAGDQVLGDAVKIVKRLEKRNRQGDLLTRYVNRAGTTRISTVVTFHETRVIFDYDGEAMAEPLALDIDARRSLRALYLGRYYLGIQEHVLDQLENEVKLRFFESGTGGKTDMATWQRSLAVARRCTHALVSSAFLLKLIGDVRVDAEVPENSQAIVFKDCKKGGAKLLRAFDALRGAGSSVQVLVVLMEGHGSATVQIKAGRRAVSLVRPARVEDEKGKNWLGCGDLFRAEFVHQVLSNPRVSLKRAATEASKVVAAKIQRMSFLAEPVA